MSAFGSLEQIGQKSIRMLVRAGTERDSGGRHSESGIWTAKHELVESLPLATVDSVSKVKAVVISYFCKLLRSQF